jgi:hypothetical protein
MFLGRKKELQYFNGIYGSDQAEFIALYGRRRIGKTELLKVFASDRKHVFYSAKECTDYEQLGAFSEKLLGKGRRFDDWDAVFEHLSNIALEEKILVILDEFPYMAKGNPSLASTIQHAWDHKLKDTKLKLVICGSSMSFMEKQVLSEKNPLFGRLTGIYKLDEISFEETAEFFPNYDLEDQLAVYSILGGVPHYLLQFNPEQTIKENILNSILNKGRILYTEVDFLLKQELREPQVYYTIIEKVAYGCTKLNDIHTKTQIANNKLSVYLKNLIELNIIKREYPVTEKLKVKVNLHSGIYRLANNYFKFYFRFLFPNISDIEEGYIEEVYTDEIEPNLNEYISRTYEDVCIALLKARISKSRIPYRIKHLGRWWNKTDEIDIVGFNDDNQYVFGECKWRNQKCDVSVLRKLQDKAQKSFSHKEAHYYLFSKGGFTAQLLQLAQQDETVHLIEKIRFLD